MLLKIDNEGGIFIAGKRVNPQGHPYHLVDRSP
jgi:hypothetical protein